MGWRLGALFPVLTSVENSIPRNKPPLQTMFIWVKLEQTKEVGVCYGKVAPWPPAAAGWHVCPFLVEFFGFCHFHPTPTLESHYAALASLELAV